jgi:hypothetical protein
MLPHTPPPCRASLHLYPFYHGRRLPVDYCIYWSIGGHQISNFFVVLFRHPKRLDKAPPTCSNLAAPCLSRPPTANSNSRLVEASIFLTAATYNQCTITSQFFGAAKHDQECAAWDHGKLRHHEMGAPLVCPWIETRTKLLECGQCYWSCFCGCVDVVLWWQHFL